jgi:hypothetical protein
MLPNGISIRTPLGQATAVVIVSPVTGEPVDIQDTVQTETPASGDTVVMTASAGNNTLVIEGAGTLAELTVEFPDDGVTRVGQILRIAPLVAITDLTLTGSTFINPPVTLAANEVAQLQKISATEWLRIS